MTTRRHGAPGRTEKFPDFEWVDEVVSLEPTESVGREVPSADRATEGFIEVPQVTRRGIGWVFAWAGAITVIGLAATVLVEFACVLAAEHTLSIAARAGALEATLPRATYQSITATVERRLNNYPLLKKQLRRSLLQNCAQVQSQFRPRAGDEFAIAISAPSSGAVPNWLRAVSLWRPESDIQARAERQLPGRKLVSGAGLTARN